MINSHSFINRTHCPTCCCDRLKSLYSEDFAESDLKAYLMSAYGSTVTLDDFQCLAGTRYSLRQCMECDLIFQENIPSPALMSILYEDWIDASKARNQQRTYGISYYSLYSQDIVQMLAYLGKPPASIKVLDFGMGWGKWALMAKAFGCEVYGVELSGQRIEYAQTNGISIIHWQDILDYEFDIINTDQVFEHLADPVEVLTQLKQSLKPDGLLKICVPNSFGMRYRLRQMDWSAPKGSPKSLNPVAPLEHINCFYRKSMLKFAYRVGLSEVKIPISMQYQYTTAWDGPKRWLRNLIMPIYRNILGLQNYYLFKNSSP
jgi:SAM-dependent methyltransferase